MEPIYVAQIFPRFKLLVFLLFSPILANPRIINFVVLLWLLFFVFHKKRDRNTHLNAKDIVRSTGEPWVLTHVSTEVEHIDFVELLRQILAHSVEGNVV